MTYEDIRLHLEKLDAENARQMAAIEDAFPELVLKGIGGLVLGVLVGYVIVRIQYFLASQEAEEMNRASEG